MTEHPVPVIPPSRVPKGSSGQSKNKWQIRTEEAEAKLQRVRSELFDIFQYGKLGNGTSIKEQAERIAANQSKGFDMRGRLLDLLRFLDEETYHAK